MFHRYSRLPIKVRTASKLKKVEKKFEHEMMRMISAARLTGHEYMQEQLLITISYKDRV